MNVKKKNKVDDLINRLRGRCAKVVDKKNFNYKSRAFQCLGKPGHDFLGVRKLEPISIKERLASCKTIEHQILALRQLTQLTRKDYHKRLKFTKRFLTCLERHHGAYYEGILFGSTVNGLGFRNSDVDLRLRRLMEVEDGVFEPVALDEFETEIILRNIAYQTGKCCPAIGEYVPSSRCPVAKLTFYQSNVDAFQPNIDSSAFIEGLKYDVSLSPSNLASFNSKFLRFLCHLEPKFHLLATTLRYWSNVHRLIVPGYLSSYALVNMLIFFCQTVEPPLLPTVDYMRDLYLESSQEYMDEEKKLRAISQLEWQCIICFKKQHYKPSRNTDTVSVLLLKFFEFCLNFPYSTHIITIRPGHAINRKEFEQTTLYHPGLPITTHLCIQDPFDLKHNLTGGMQGGHFRLFMITVRYSYERLFNELMNRFTKPNANEMKHLSLEEKDWGLNALFVKLTEEELKEA